MRAAFILISTALLAACNMAAEAQQALTGAEGAQTRQAYDLAGFDRVSLGGHYDVIVNVGPAHSVRAEGDAEEIARMEILVEDGALQIRRKRERGVQLSYRSRPVTVYVTAPAIRGAAIGGSGDIRIDRVEGPEFAGSIGGSGDLSVDAMRVDEARFSIAGSGAVRAAGSAGRSSVSVAGSGNVELSNLRTDASSVSVVGSGDVRVNAVRTADISVMGSGDVSIAGGARCSVNKMGSGSVNCSG